MLSGVIFECTVIRALPIYWWGAVLIFVVVVATAVAASDDDDDDEGFFWGRGIILELRILSALHFVITDAT